MTDNMRVAIDVGGTFTDVVTLDPSQNSITFEKVPSTQRDPAVGVIDGFDKTHFDADAVRSFNHGTTLGLNALLTRTGARTAIISTRGFRDVYLLGRTNRNVMYDITYRKADALLERRDTFEVTERIRADGTIETPFSDTDAYRVAHQIADAGYGAVAVGFLHSYLRPAHESRMRHILEEVSPAVEVTLSHELSREYREYERTSTAVLDAYVKPVMRTYIARLQDELADRGFAGEFFMSHSAGAAMTATAAREAPVNLILSGPAGGVAGAAGMATLLARPNLITIDMGGTSLDASLVVGEKPIRTHETEFQGLPVNTQALDIETIGAGGGSIVYLDEGGALQAGPQSAGADPGPAAYGRGGTDPTFTDAAVVVGYLPSAVSLSGGLKLDRSRANSALDPIASHLDMSLTEVAHGVIDISVTKIVGAIRSITIEIGYDPTEFSLMSYGGAGGLVAAQVARELGIPEVIIPPGQGAFSAFGMLLNDVEHEFAQTWVVPLADADQTTVDRVYSQLESDATQQLSREGFGGDKQCLSREVSVRYSGQEHTVIVPLTKDTPNLHVDIADQFNSLHLQRYGHSMDDPIEITTFRLKAVGLLEKPEIPTVRKRHESDPTLESVTDTVTVQDRRDRQVGYTWVGRETLRSDDALQGPAIVTEHTGTTVIGEEDQLLIGTRGELIVTVGDEH